MKQYNKIFIIIFVFITINCQESNNIITLFIDEYPQETQNKIDNEQIKKLCTIFDVRKSCNGIEFPFNYGILATYAGYLGLSDLNGQITFPRKTQKPSINLLVTTKISPVFLFRNTIAYWEITDPINTKMYKLDKKQDDETKLFYWDVQERNLPKNNIIPIHTIIIFADPNSIIIPLGITIAKQSAQLILPRIYAKNNFDHIRNSLFVLNTRPFFSSVKKVVKDVPRGFESQIMS